MTVGRSPGNDRKPEVIQAGSLSSDRGLEKMSDILLSLILKRRARGAGLKELLGGLERKVILDVLLECGGNQAQTARILNIKVTTLGEKIKRYGILAEIKRSISPKELFLNRLLLREHPESRRSFDSAEVP